MKRGITKALSLALVALGLSVAFTACSDRPSRQLSLTTDPSPPLTDEAERLAKLQMIRVYDVTPIDGSAAGWTEMHSYEVAERASATCQGYCYVSNLCGHAACYAKA